MKQWEPLADRIPLDVRRLATQLRRMKERGGLTVPALAARTAQPVSLWTRALAGRHLPPLDAVEVLAQASGADYDRVAALWRLAHKAATGPEERVWGRPVPDPDPLDPLGPEEGLPGRRRGALLLSSVGLLAVAALVAVILTAVPGGGRASANLAAPSSSGVDGLDAPAPAAKPRPVRPSGTGLAATGPAATPIDRSVAVPGSTVLAVPGLATTPGGTTSSPAPGPAPTSAPVTPPSSPTATPTTPAGPTPSPTPSPCAGLMLLGLCLS